MWGHQTGVLIAGLGWVLRGQVVVALLHAVWLIAAGFWFRLRVAVAEQSGR